MYSKSNEKDQSGLIDAQLTPLAVVNALNKHIIGQFDAKRSVAIALRSQWRRNVLTDDSLKNNITPRNILMIGPTGSGKTEIARRLASIANAPFIVAEATKFCKVGYCGGRLTEIITSLATKTLNNMKTTYLQLQEEKKEKALQTNENSINHFLAKELQKSNHDLIDKDITLLQEEVNEGIHNNKTLFLVRYEVTALDEDTNIKQSLSNSVVGTVEECRNAMKNSFLNVFEQTVLKGLHQQIVRIIENKGIVFIDEIDKLIPHLDKPTVSDLPVQQELLSLIEGSTVNTCIGDIKTHGILFICAGAFFSKNPSDLMPELLGRLPIHVTLTALGEDEFYRLLIEPEYSLVRVQKALMKTEGIELNFTEGALRVMARHAVEANKKLNDLGARRMHQIMDSVMKDLSYQAKTSSDQECDEIVVIDEEYARERLSL